MADPAFVPTDEAARRAGLTERTMRRRIASGEIPVFKAPYDRRIRLIRAEDLYRLASPVPVSRAVDQKAAEDAA